MQQKGPSDVAAVAKNQKMRPPIIEIGAYAFS